MNEYLKNDKAVKIWLEYLKIIVIYQKLGIYEEIENNYKLNRLIEVIEEYNDIIFGDENHEKDI